jgi:hypothetical protein
MKNSGKIDIKDIYIDLIKRTKSRQNNIINKYRLIDHPENDRQTFTKLIIGELELILHDLFKNSKITKDIHTQKEYYRIDLISWSDRSSDVVNELKFTTHMWDLDIVIEHENNENDWMDEVVKLLYINCPRRLVISYIDRKDDGKPDKDIPFLELIVKCINILDPGGKKGLIKNGDQFAIMLGTSCFDSKIDTSDERYYDEQINYQLYFIEFNSREYEYTAYSEM